VELGDGEEGIATGQACVFYESDAHEARVLGGGFIARTLKPSELPLQNFDSAGQASSGEAAAQPSAARN
jgi:hypothetical protein